MLNLSDTFLITCNIIGVTIAFVHTLKYYGSNMAMTLVFVGISMFNLATEISRIRSSGDQK
jgi:hypothetical protein